MTFDSSGEDNVMVVTRDRTIYARVRIPDEPRLASSPCKRRFGWRRFGGKLMSGSVTMVRKLGNTVNAGGGR